jgi:hypothetical protein
VDDVEVLAGLLGRRSDAGGCGEGRGVGEPWAAVTDFGSRVAVRTTPERDRDWKVRPSG